jgi:hypothetical protein
MRGLLPQNGILSKMLPKKHGQERGGHMRWIAPVHPKVNDLTTDIKQAIDSGADFICVGMFEFHARENAIIARNAIAGGATHPRSRHG